MKIVILLACLNILVIATQTDQNCPGESSSPIVYQQEYLEALFNADIVASMNFMPTVNDGEDITINQIDIRLLSEECYSDESCLNEKESSVNKYQQKMQAIQCIHGLFILKVLDELEEIMYNEKTTSINQLNKLLRIPVLRKHFYLTSMMSLLHLAKWDAYDWQIKMFTFVAGLINLDTNFRKYKEHFRNYNVRMREQVVEFVNQCVLHKHLSCPGNKIPERARLTCLLDNIYSQMDFLYNASAFATFRFFEHYSVKNLMLMDLYSKHDFIFDWSMTDIGLKTENVKSQLIEYTTLYRKRQSTHKWELDPIGGNKYNALIAKCIHLKVVFTAWFHLHYYRNFLSRLRDEDEQQFMGKGPLVKIWHTPIFPIQRALRTFRFDENIYWSAIRLMMVELTKNMKEEVVEREEYTRNYFCRAVEDLGLASAFDTNLKLQQLVVAKEHGLMYERIKANGEMLDDYTDKVLCALSPADGTFIRLIVSAEGNETFVMR